MRQSKWWRQIGEQFGALLTELTTSEIDDLSVFGTDDPSGGTPTISRPTETQPLPVWREKRMATAFRPWDWRCLEMRQISPEVETSRSSAGGLIAKRTVSDAGSAPPSPAAVRSRRL